MKYRQYTGTRATSQSQPMPGTNQAPNSAGGFAWAVDDWIRLDRFLVLGSEGGSYYASERALTVENAQAVARCLAQDGVRAVERIAEISERGRAPKNDPAIFALALAAGTGDDATRRAALAALPRVCRTGTHLLHFAEYIEGFRGWGRGLRAAVGAWYSRTPAGDLAYQLVKYRQRDGWSHRDLLRLAHPQAPDESHQVLYHWATRGWEWVGDEPHPDQALRIVWAFERAARARDESTVVRLIRDYRLPREAVPTQWLTSARVWEALLEDMPMTALIRNLATMTRVGLVAQGADATRRVVAQLGDGERLRRARVHPISVLAALKTYAAGRGARGDARWSPVAAVIDALDAAFYASFGNVAPAGKRLVLALDVSGSMSSGMVAGVPGLTPRVAAAAMALVTAATEPSCRIMGFSHELVEIGISPRQRLDDVLKAIDAIPMGATDSALPMLWAMGRKLHADAFVIYTDSETWFGTVHSVQALRQYRERLAIPARLVTVGMVSKGFSIADPQDGGMLDVVGFDTATPNLVGDFVR